MAELKKLGLFETGDKKLTAEEKAALVKK